MKRLAIFNHLFVIMVMTGTCDYCFDDRDFVHISHSLCVCVCVCVFVCVCVCTGLFDLNNLILNEDLN